MVTLFRNSKSILLTRFAMSLLFASVIVPPAECGKTGKPDPYQRFAGSSNLNLSAGIYPAASRKACEQIQMSSSLQVENPPPLAAGSFNDGLSENNQVERNLIQALEQQLLLRRMSAEIDARSTPENRIRDFITAYQNACSSRGGRVTADRLLENWLGGGKTSSDGRIQGAVTVNNGEYNRVDISILAFDSHGYFAGLDEIGSYGTSYSIEDLPAGDYFVVTASWKNYYVDEIYKDRPSPVLETGSWRDAQKVTLAESATAGNIDFDLKLSARFHLTVNRADGTSPITDSEVTITLTPFDRPEVLIRDIYEYYDDGQFYFFVPFLGDFKFSVEVSGKPVTWYGSTADWSLGQKISVVQLDGNETEVTLVLAGTGSIGQEGQVAGFITGGGALKMVFAFRAEDLALENLALIFWGSYTIENLPAGEYYIYADDYLGNATGRGSLLGTFYPDAADIAHAQKVAVLAGQTTSGINIALRKGATISGKITDADGMPLDSMLVFALKMDFPDASPVNLFTQFHIGLGSTDSTGAYAIAGLPPGPYVIRTLSTYTMTIFWGFPFIQKGPQFDRVVDEYYGGVYNMLLIESARRVQVADTGAVRDIDFALQKAKFIRGRLTDAASGNPVAQAAIVALQDTVDFPFFIIPKIEENGDYRLGPLPSGKYRVFASSYAGSQDNTLPEFYDDSKSIGSSAVVELADTDRDGIDFAFDPGATVEGFVDLAEGAAFEPAGDDTLSNFPVVLFDAATGAYVRQGFVQINGGYRISRLMPGDYKLLALPDEAPYAATYYGGGNRFDDAASQVFHLNQGQTLQLNLELEKGGGRIAGAVLDLQKGTPVSNCLVLAYDGTGHAAGMGITDGNSRGIVNQQATGAYRIDGLGQGDYFVSTWGLADDAGLAGSIPGYLISETEPDIFGLLGEMLNFLFATDMSLYSDQWYQEVPITSGFNFRDLFLSFSSYPPVSEFDQALVPLFMPVPYYRPVPYSASTVTVPAAGSVSNIDFQLTSENIEDLLVSVESGPESAAVPEECVLLASYPNPFNGTSRIRFNLPENARVDLAVYNIRGERVADLARGIDLKAGAHTFTWNGRDDKNHAVPSAIYVAVLEAPNIKKAVKLTLAR
jgi:hypothetical protein